MKNSKNLLVQKYWLSRAKKGDSESFAKIYDELVDKIYRFVFFKVNSVEEAEDITSQSFLKVWHYIQEKEDEVQSIRAFVYKTARNLIIDYYRTKSKTVTLENNAMAEDNRAFSLRLVDNRLETRIEIDSDMENVLAALNLLKDEYREIIILKYIEELSTKEICQILNKNSNAVRAQMLRALNALKEIIPNDRKRFYQTTKKTPVS